MLKFSKRSLKDNSGATAIEYSLLAALIAVAIILAVRSFADSTSSMFSSVGSSITSAGQ